MRKEPNFQGRGEGEFKAIKMSLHKLFNSGINQQPGFASYVDLNFLK